MAYGIARVENMDKIPYQVAFSAQFRIQLGAVPYSCVHIRRIDKSLAASINKLQIIPIKSETTIEKSDLDATHASILLKGIFTTFRLTL
jgi:hypothetical protein